MVTKVRKSDVCVCLGKCLSFVSSVGRGNTILSEYE